MLRALVVVAVVLGAVTAAAEEITLPPDHAYARLKPGPGANVTQKSCVLCHSTDYIVMQPAGDLKQWQGVVTKMMKVYAAPVSEQDAKAIAEYLATSYGK